MDPIGFVMYIDLQNPVDIVRKPHLHTLLSSGGRRDLNLKLTELEVGLGIVSLPLVDPHSDCLLVVAQRVERVLHTGGQNAVALDHRGHMRPGVLFVVVAGNPKGERADIGHHDVTDFPILRLDPGVDPNSLRNDRIGRAEFRRFDAEDMGEIGAHHRHPARASHQQNLVDLADRAAAVGKRAGNHLVHPLEERRGDPHKQLPGEEQGMLLLLLLLEQQHLRLFGERLLAKFRLFEQCCLPDRREQVKGDPVFLAEIAGDGLVEVISAEVVVPGDR